MFVHISVCRWKIQDQHLIYLKTSHEMSHAHGSHFLIKLKNTKQKAKSFNESLKEAGLEGEC